MFVDGGKLLGGEDLGSQEEGGAVDNNLLEISSKCENISAAEAWMTVSVIRGYFWSEASSLPGCTCRPGSHNKKTQIFW